MLLKPLTKVDSFVSETVNDKCLKMLYVTDITNQSIFNELNAL